MKFNRRYFHGAPGVFYSAIANKVFILRPSSSLIVDKCGNFIGYAYSYEDDENEFRSAMIRSWPKGSTVRIGDL